MGINWDNPVREWYEFHREDYAAVKDRLRACRNIMLNGREDAATDMLQKSTVFAVMSIQTERERHERAFTAFYGGNTDLETACGMTVYGNQKANWLYDSFANFDYSEVVTRLRDGNERAALAYLANEFTGLSWVKAGFALAMVGVWELACPDTRTKQQLGIEGRIRTSEDYFEALDAIDDCMDVDEPLFVKQWCLYDRQADEHARHMAFYREVNPYL